MRWKRRPRAPAAGAGVTDPVRPPNRRPIGVELSASSLLCGRATRSRGGGVLRLPVADVTPMRDVPNFQDLAAQNRHPGQRALSRQKHRQRSLSVFRPHIRTLHRRALTAKTTPAPSRRATAIKIPGAMVQPNEMPMRLRNAHSHFLLNLGYLKTTQTAALQTARATSAVPRTTGSTEQTSVAKVAHTHESAPRNAVNGALRWTGA